MFLIICLVADSASFWVVRHRLSQSLDLALDAALVGGVVEEDLIWGRHISRKRDAEHQAWEVLRKNMDGSLLNSLFFSFDLHQDRDMIWVEGSAKVETPFLLGALAGKGRREILVSKKLNYQGSYK